MPFELTEEKKKTGYIILRASNLIITALCVPLALLYCKKFSVEVMGGGSFNFVATLYSLAFILYAEQYFFPLDFKGALKVTGSMFLNLLIGFSFAEDSLLYGSFQIFYTTLWVQSITTVGLAIIMLVDKYKPLPFFNHGPEVDKNVHWYGFFGVLFIGSPIIVAPLLMGNPFFYELSQLENYEKWTLITALSLNVIYNVYRIGKIPFDSSKEDYKEKSKSLSNWEGGISLMFFLTLLAIFAISIMD